MKIGDKVRLTEKGRAVLDENATVPEDAEGVITGIWNPRCSNAPSLAYVDFPSDPDICMDYAFYKGDLEVIKMEENTAARVIEEVGELRYLYHATIVDNFGTLSRLHSLITSDVRS